MMDGEQEKKVVKVEADGKHGNPVQANKVFREIEVIEEIKVIEIQGRGLPHSHLLLWSKDLPM